MKFRDYNPHQILLLPNSLEDMIPNNHLVRGLDIIIDQFDLTELYDSYSEEGQPGYHAKMLLKILLYGYMIGIRSSRKIASELESNVFFMYLSAMQRPDFRTISDFRKDKKEYISEYYKQLLQIIENMGLIKLSHVAIDGSKIEANASKKRMKDKENLIKLEEKIQHIFNEAEEVDKQEDRKYGQDKRGDELSEDLSDNGTKKKFIEKIKNAKKYMEENQLERVNITDPDTRFMRTSDGGTEVCYNGQIVVDNEYQIIVANDLVSAEDDHEQFIPMYKAVKTNIGKEPSVTSADAGYQSGKVYLYLENNEINAYMPDSKFNAETDKEGKEKLGKYDRRNFKYKEESNTYICPNGKELEFLENHSRNGVKFKIYRGKECKTARDCITKKDAEYRQIQIYENDKFKAEMRTKLLSPLILKNDILTLKNMDFK